MGKKRDVQMSFLWTKESVVQMFEGKQGNYLSFVRGCASLNSCFVLEIQGGLLLIEILMHASVVNGHYIFAVRFNVNVKAVFSTNGISNLVNQGKHVFALAPHGNLTSILPEMVI